MAQTITLDGNTYSVKGDDFAIEPTKAASLDRGVDGTVVRQESGVFSNKYAMTLRCSTTDLANLRTSFNKTAVTGTPPTNLLNFIDIEGMQWDPASGSSTSTHIYSTGVYFVKMGKPRPVTQRGWDSTNRFWVDIELHVNSKGLRS
jgi:hypothetical protein